MLSKVFHLETAAKGAGMFCMWRFPFLAHMLSFCIIIIIIIMIIIIIIIIL